MEDHANLSRAASSDEHSFGELVGGSSPMRLLYDAITRMTQSTPPVLLIGETGTGKELVARTIHSSGPRRDKAFVPIDCSALVPTLMESELFGHVRGAFTGADHNKRGLLQCANGGTLFLDEIGELPVYLQAKMLRTLQEREIRPVGSTDRIPLNIRIIAATNRNLEAAVQAGTFRQDLFFRLNVVQIRLPPLRERKIDIPLLVAHFLHRFSSHSPQVDAVSYEALRVLIAYHWPGNVRELQNAVERALALSSETTLTIDDFAGVRLATLPSDLPEENELVPLAELERRAVLQALHQASGDKPAAARLLGIGKTTLYRKLKEYAEKSSAILAKS
jgi:transcriptional regulator with PAS, ATPase and Fis domain